MSGARPAKGERKKAKQPTAEDLFGIHMDELGIEYVRQWPFCEGRKWAADFSFLPNIMLHGCQILVEIDGFFKGRHGAGWGKDYERDRTAARLGYFTLRFSTKEVLTGKAKAWIAENLLGGKG